MNGALAIVAQQLRASAADELGDANRQAIDDARDAIALLHAAGTPAAARVAERLARALAGRGQALKVLGIHVPRGKRNLVPERAVLRRLVDVDLEALAAFSGERSAKRQAEAIVRMWKADHPHTSLLRVYRAAGAELPLSATKLACRLRVIERENAKS